MPEGDKGEAAALALAWEGEILVTAGKPWDGETAETLAPPREGETARTAEAGTPLAPKTAVGTTPSPSSKRGSEVTLHATPSRFKASRRVVARDHAGPLKVWEAVSAAETHEVAAPQVHRPLGTLAKAETTLSPLGAEHATAGTALLAGTLVTAVV